MPNISVCNTNLPQGLNGKCVKHNRIDTNKGLKFKMRDTDWLLGLITRIRIRVPSVFCILETKDARKGCKVNKQKVTRGRLDFRRFLESGLRSPEKSLRGGGGGGGR